MKRLNNKLLKPGNFKYIYLLVACIIFLFPLFIMIMGSFKTPTDLSRNPGGFPTKITLENYYILFTSNIVLIRGFLNSVYVTLMYIILSTLLTSMGAYAFAKFQFKGKDFLFMVLLATMMIPKQVLIPPQYLMFAKTGLLDTYTVQIVGNAAKAFGIFMLRQYFEAVPDSILESAKIEGAGQWTIFSRLVLPMSTPALGAFAILQFNNKWNDFLFPALYIRNLTKAPFMVILPQLVTEEGNELMVPWTLILAGCTFVSIPVIIAFLFLQDKIMTSMTAGAVKE